MRIKLGHFNKKHLYTCLILLSFSLIAFKGKNDIRYVKDLKDFKTHTSNHIQNVYSLGMYLYYQHRTTLFKDIPEHIIREKLLVHDYEKIADIENLKPHGYQDNRTFLERLFDYYGNRKNSGMKNLINELNSYAGFYDQSIFKKYGLLNRDGSPNEIAEKLIMIEKIADLVEREKNPISKEEFGKPKMVPAANYLNGRLEKTLARELAKVYSTVVPVNPLVSLANSARKGPTCHTLFN